MKFKVEGVSKYGIKGPTKWFNADKYAENPVDFSHLKKGDMVEVELNEKGFMTGLTKVSSNEVADVKPPSPEQEQMKPTEVRKTFVAPDQSQIARSVAVKSVLDSLLLANQILRLELSASETDAFVEARLDMYTNYILTGRLSGSKEKVLN